MNTFMSIWHRLYNRALGSKKKQWRDEAVPHVTSNCCHFVNDYSRVRMSNSDKCLLPRLLSL